MELKFESIEFNKLLGLIASSNNEKLQDAFLDYQNEKNENNARYLKHLDKMLKEAESSKKPALNIADVSGSISAKSEMVNALTNTMKVNKETLGEYYAIRDKTLEKLKATLDSI